MSTCLYTRVIEKITCRNGVLGKQNWVMNDLSHIYRKE